jgi:hypothetical protein
MVSYPKIVYLTGYSKNQPSGEEMLPMRMIKILYYKKLKAIII